VAELFAAKGADAHLDAFVDALIDDLAGDLAHAGRFEGRARLLHALAEAERLSEVEPHLDRLILQSWHLVGDERELATDGSLSDWAVDAAALAPESILLVPVPKAKPPAKPPSGFAVQLDDPVLGRKLTFAYSVERLG